MSILTYSYGTYVMLASGKLEVVLDIFSVSCLYRICAFKSELHLYELYADIMSTERSPRLLRGIPKLQRIRNRITMAK